MTKKAVTRVAVFLFTLGIAISASAGGASVKIINSSNWEIHHLFISPADEGKWGKDQLGDKVVGTGDSFTITGIPCDDYDVKVVDEDGDSCVIAGAHLCADDSYWKITDEELESCDTDD
ncbi:MAG TPA: hypothetical protein VMU84_12930 [Thermoanaerobaculia bacterium]|nr:hypothetical protein [Thermoanaerobaculia bacterium]